MSADHALANMLEWPAYEEAEGNSTAQRKLAFSGTKFINVALGWSRYTTGIKWITDWDDEPMQSVVVKDPALYDLSPTTVLFTFKGHPFEGLSTYSLVDPANRLTTLTSEARAASVTFVPHEYELLKAIANAPDDQRLECMRVLGLIDADYDEEGYVERGPDPQTVDFELMALLEPGQSAS